MGDFLSHLVDAPLANILIVAGLFFLGIAAVGKVVGKIEPDKIGRAATGLLGVVLLAAGIKIHIQSDQGIPASVQPVIHAFTVIPPEITKGSKVTIHWEVSDADDVRLEPFGQVPLMGDRVVEPQETTTYKLDATNKTDGKNGVYQQVVVTAVTGDRQKKEENNSLLQRQPPDTKPNGKSNLDESPVYTSQAPPSLPDYNQPPDPGGNSVWVPGSWYYDLAQVDYYWVPGAWVTPPNNLVWTPPYWEYETDGRYRWHSGYWALHVGFYGGIDYGFGYTGNGYSKSPAKSRSAIGCNGGPNRPKKPPAEKEEPARQDRHTPPTAEQVQLEHESSKTRGQFYQATQGRPRSMSLPGRLSASAGFPSQADPISQNRDKSISSDTETSGRGPGSLGDRSNPCGQGSARRSAGTPCDTQYPHKKDGHDSGTDKRTKKEPPSPATPRKESHLPSQPKVQPPQSKTPQSQKH